MRWQDWITWLPVAEKKFPARLKVCLQFTVEKVVVEEEEEEEGEEEEVEEEEEEEEVGVDEKFHFQNLQNANVWFGTMLPISK